MSGIVIGVDLGGTIVRAGAFDPHGQILAMRSTEIEAHQGPFPGMQRIAALIDRLLKDLTPYSPLTRAETPSTSEPDSSPPARGELPETTEPAPPLPAKGEALDTKKFDSPLPSKGEGSGVRVIPSPFTLLGIGIGCSGPVDSQRGLINNPYTLPGWQEVPILDWLQQRFDVLMTLENDADVAALGEYWRGAGRGVSRLYAITVGTGIGTALIIDGHIYRGLDGSHPDGGHQVIDPSGPLCYCGAHGCWESLASGSAIARIAQEAVGAAQSSSLSNLDPSQITAHRVADAARQGDPLALQVIHRAAEYFALGIVNVVTLFVPEVIVLSGGVMQSADLFMPAIQAAMQRHNVMVPAIRVRILSARLGYLAGIYGAAYTIVQRLPSTNLERINE